LSYLDLCMNQLANFPEYFSNLNKLTYLDLGHNQLAFLPEVICSLKKLNRLILRNNQISTLPENILNLTNLVELDLSNNPLTDLSVLQKLPNLQEVRFSGVNLPRRYWDKLSNWRPEWLLDEENADIRNMLAAQVRHQSICDRLNATLLDS
jgi:leucine-rich repeat protein SHOC2